MRITSQAVWLVSHRAYQARRKRVSQSVPLRSSKTGQREGRPLSSGAAAKGIEIDPATRAVAVMFKLALRGWPLFLLFATGTALSEHRLICQNELSGQAEIVVVKEARSFGEAVERIQRDPQYGYYNHRRCRDAANSRASIHTFTYPTVRGYRLDWCRQWATDCGRGAADAFCRGARYSRAKSWEKDPNIGQHSPTYVIETG
jgi:hypothetical protein